VEKKIPGRKSPEIIAELGTSHGGDPVKAAELAAAAAEAGADWIKCQIVFAAEILHPKTGKVALPGGAVSLYEAFRALERGPDFYENLKNEAENRGLRFLASPFGPKSAALLKELNPEAVKIASPELNYRALLEETASWGLPLYLSAGVSTLGDIEEALALVRGASPPASPLAGAPDTGGSGAALTLLHCVTAYPAPPEDYNLRLIPRLAGIFGVSAGVSDHSLDPALVPVLAASLGAGAIEKHLCLSRKDPGLDDPIALDPADFGRMVREVRRAARRTALMEGPAVREELSAEYGSALVEQTLGTGVKALAPSEAANYGRTNRSLHALRDIEAGETLGPDMFAVLRTEKILRPGLHPRWEPFLAGRKARTFIPAGEGIRFEDI
jgi:sialic acid synthase SpsE